MKKHGWIQKGYRFEHGDVTRGQMRTFIAAYEAEHGYAPTQREIARACFITEPVVRHHLKVMARIGQLTHQPGKHRSIRLTEAA